jgi:hypothetical protein
LRADLEPSALRVRDIDFETQLFPLHDEPDLAIGEHKSARLADDQDRPAGDDLPKRGKPRLAIETYEQHTCRQRLLECEHAHDNDCMTVNPAPSHELRELRSQRFLAEHTDDERNAGLSLDFIRPFDELGEVVEECGLDLAFSDGGEGLRRERRRATRRRDEERGESDKSRVPRRLQNRYPNLPTTARPFC